jgi:hypothetical protein
MPLWLIPPLVLVLPPLIWGWLTYRVMSFDALAEHASPEERATCCARTGCRCWASACCAGYLGAAPSIVWASGLLFAAAFFVLVPIAIWIYTWCSPSPRSGSRTTAWMRWRSCARSEPRRWPPNRPAALERR